MAVLAPALLIALFLTSDESSDSVRRSLVRSYGYDVTCDPRLSAVTAPPWIAPLLLPAIGGRIVACGFKRGRG